MRLENEVEVAGNRKSWRGEVVIRTLKLFVR